MGGSADKAVQASNRRTAFRLPTALAVRVRCAEAIAGMDGWTREGGARVLESVTEDVSAGGLRFRAPAVLARGTPLSVAFALDETRAEAHGEVAHVSADEFGAGIGISFTDLGVATTSRLVRFITARERLRLPTVPIMYPINGHAGRDQVELDGATEECSPSYVRVLLSHAVRPGEHVVMVVNVGRSEMRLTGRVVTCRRADQLWRAEVELGDLAGTVSLQWRELVVRIRDAAR